MLEGIEALANGSPPPDMSAAKYHESYTNLLQNINYTRKQSTHRQTFAAIYKGLYKKGLFVLTLPLFLQSAHSKLRAEAGVLLKTGGVIGMPCRESPMKGGSQNGGRNHGHLDSAHSVAGLD